MGYVHLQSGDNTKLFGKMAKWLYAFTLLLAGFWLLCILANTLSDFKFCHFDVHKTVYHCSFNQYFPDCYESRHP